VHGVEEGGPEFLVVQQERVLRVPAAYLCFELSGSCHRPTSLSVRYGGQYRRNLIPLDGVASFPVLPTEKRCTKCREVKPAADFWRNRATKDGLQSQCKACHYG